MKIKTLETISIILIVLGIGTFINVGTPSSYEERIALFVGIVFCFVGAGITFWIWNRKRKLKQG